MNESGGEAAISFESDDDGVKRKKVKSVSILMQYRSSPPFPVNRRLKGRKGREGHSSFS